MATLQNQLGLGLAVKQTNAMNGISPVSPTPTNSPLLGESDYSSSGYFQDEKDSSDSYTNKGIQYQYVAPNGDIGIGSNQQSAQNNVVSGSNPLAYGRASAPSASFASSPTSVTNNTVDSLSGVQNGVVNKKKRNIAESTTQASMKPLAPVETPPTQNIPDMSGFREATAGQDVQFRQSYRDALKSPVASVAPVDATGLSGAELQAYNMLTPQEQQTYKALATQGLKAQTDYLTKSKANVEFEKSQEEKRLQMEDNTDAISDMNSQRNIEEAQRSVANLKQNIGYLGTGGQPGVSSQKLDAVSNQVTLADRTLKNIIEAERLSKVNRELGQEKNSEIFTRQMKILQDDLDGKVNKTVQSALNEFTSAELAGKLDTIPEIEAFQQQLYAQLDGDLSSIMDTNIEARKFLIERYDKLAESQKTAMANKEKADAEALKRKNTLNKDMSQALGYYVNENGEALTDRVTGQNIVVPPESDVTYDKDSGQMVILTKNRDGTVGVQLKQVGTPKATPAKWERDPTTGGYYNSSSSVNPNEQMSQGGYLNIARTGNNVGQDTNNPGNIMGDSEGQRAIASKLGAVGFYKSPNGRTYAVFPDMQSGVNASMADLQTKLSGGSSWVNPNTTLAQFATGWVSGPNAPINQNAVNNYVNLTGATANTKISDIPLETLAKAVFANEGVDISKSANIPTQPSVAQGTQGGLEDNINVKVANIGNIAFGRTMSDTEGKRVESIIKSNPNASVNDIALAVRGLNIKDDTDKQIALEYVNIFDKMSDSVKPKTGLEMTISKYINAGDYKGLNEFVTKNVDRQVKADSDSPILTPEYNVGKQRTDKLVGLIEKNKDKLGIVSGNVSDFLQKFEGDKDYQQIKTILQMSQADMRKYFAGSAVTETEMKALADFIGGSTKMSPDNLVTMLQTLDEDRTNTYNAQREGFQIPNVKAVQAKKKLGGFSLSDILSKLK